MLVFNVKEGMEIHIGPKMVMTCDHVTDHFIRFTIPHVIAAHLPCGDTIDITPEVSVKYMTERRLGFEAPRSITIDRHDVFHVRRDKLERLVNDGK